MALTDQPYLPLYVDDWMNNSKLKVCSSAAHGVMISIMCLMHKEIKYGKILLKQKFKQKDNQNENFALQISKQSSFELIEVLPAFVELVEEGVLKIEGDYLICERMIRDAEISAKRSLSGKIGGENTQKFAKANIESNSKANAVNEIENKTEIENVNENSEKSVCGVEVYKIVSPSKFPTWRSDCISFFQDEIFKKKAKIQFGISMGVLEERITAFLKEQDLKENYKNISGLKSYFPNWHKVYYPKSDNLGMSSSKGFVDVLDNLDYSQLQSESWD